ncbi:MAG: tripartite tricarboxylate transporter substrate binding protein [Burkholderiaceae bacterium]|nr:tripartite tricarboxylate transporter substrate binding protein [Burkholderiaceae bacterium]
MLSIKHRLCAALLGACALAGAGAVSAQSYPAKPIQIVVPFPAGGPNDILARTIGQELAASLKQPVIIDNRAGATGNIGAQAVARAAPDGYTLLITLDSSITANPAIYGKRMGFDAERDLQPVAMLASFNQMLVVNPSAGVADFKQFVDAARKGLNYASAGNASPGHLTMEALQSLIGSQLNHIPYRGNAPAVVDLLGGQVHAGFVATPAVLQHVASGKLTALAVSGSKRSPLAPNVPTIAELGFPAATSEFGYVLLAPAKTPEAVVQLLNAQVRKALASESVRARLRVLDIEPVASSPQEAAAALKTGRQKWAKVIKDRKILGD